MRLSKLLSNTLARANKGKNIEEEVKEITSVIKGAVKTYGGDTKNAFENNKAAKVVTISGGRPCGMSVLDDASLLAVIIKEQKAIAREFCETEADENYSANAELARAIATNGAILGACFWLTEENEANNLL